MKDVEVMKVGWSRERRMDGIEGSHFENCIMHGGAEQQQWLQEDLPITESHRFHFNV